MLPRRATALNRAITMIMLAGAAVSASSAVAQRPSRLMPPPVDNERPDPRQTRPLPEIVAQVQSRSPYDAMDYIGVAGFDTHSLIYILRFLDGRQVIVVRVDGRSGRIIGQPTAR